MTLQELNAQQFAQLNKLTHARIDLIFRRSGLTRKQQAERQRHVLADWARLEKELNIKVKPEEVVREAQRRQQLQEAAVG